MGGIQQATRGDIHARTRARNRPPGLRFFWPSVFNLGKISLVDGPVRITNPLLDVLEVLVDAALEHGGQKLHGWAIMKAVTRSGPTVYGVLDRLEDAGWLTSRWEDQHPEPNKPRRRFYRLTPTGSTAARDLLAQRRPDRTPRTQHNPRPGWAFGTGGAS